MPFGAVAAGWTRLAFRDGLLAVHRAGDGVRLHDLGSNHSALVDATGDLPPGNYLGTSVVAWRDADGRAVVRPVADFFPAYEATPTHLNALVPAGAGPDLHHPISGPPSGSSPDNDVAWTPTAPASPAPATSASSCRRRSR